MSKLESIIRTRWKITADEITIYPYGAVYIVSIAIALIWGVFLIFLGYITRDTLSIDEAVAFWPLYLFLITIVTLLWLFAGTAVIFDHRSQLMTKKLFGIISTTQIKFDQIQAIVPAMNVRATYQYRVFAKNKPHSSGTIISSPFLSEQSPHAVEFQRNVLAAIQHFLKWSEH